MRVEDLVDSLAEVCREDEEFLARSRFFDGNVRIGIGAHAFLLRFSGGQFVGLVPDTDPTLRWDYEIIGPESDWAKVWKGERDIMEVTLPEYGSVTVRGDRVKFSADLAVIAHLTRLLPAAARKLGEDVTPAAQGSCESGPHSWATKHEVIGRYVGVNGIRTYYETIGKKGQVTFLGVHSAGRDCRQWQQIGDVLGDAGQLLALDFPGHCKSWPLPGCRCLQTMDDISSFIWAFRDAAGVTGPTVVLGCSIGGNLVYQIAAEHPNDVAALISFQGADYTPSPPPASLLFMDHPRVNPPYSHGEQSFALTGKRSPAPQREYLRWDVKCLSSVTLKSDLIAYSQFDFRGRMHEVRCPALLIRGQDDFVVTGEMVRQAAARLTNAPVVEIVMPEGVGHYSHVEQPVEHGLMVLDFLKRHRVIS